MKRPVLTVAHHRASLRPSRVLLVACLALCFVGGVAACGEDETPRSNAQDTTQTADQSQDTVAPVQCEAPSALCGVDCVDLFNDPNNCGDCGIACARSERCVQGQCGLICPDSQLACSDVCVTPSSNPLHCGQCDEVCASNEYCSLGRCITPCELDEILCGNACARLDIDPEHCGGCDQACDLPNAAAACLDSTCFPAICYRDFDNCDRAPSNGCEQDLLVNPKHCGACNQACAGGQVCAEGTCADACPSPLEPCNGGCVPPGSCGANCADSLSACGAECVDLLTSPEHCGVCDNPCAGTCDLGSCDVVPSPIQGFTVAPGDEKNTLSWTQPLDADIDRVTIRRSTTAHPTSLTSEGDLVCDDCRSPYEDKDRVNNTTYFYSAWAIDKSEQASTPALGQGTPNLWLTANLTYFKTFTATDANQFGKHVVLSGDGLTLAVAVPGNDSAIPGINGNPSNTAAADSGAVYVFTFEGGVWSQQAYIKASNPDPGDEFGASLALSFDGNTLAVGTPFEDGADPTINGDQTNNDAPHAGAVYVFVRDAGDVWSQQAYIKAPNPDSEDHFGWSVALYGGGNTLAVGAPDESSASTDPSDNSAARAGAVYIFNRSTDTWTQEAYLKAIGTGEGDNFGYALSFSGINTILAVGAPGEASATINDPYDNSAPNNGAVYVFRRSGAWSEEAYLKDPAIAVGSRLGTSLSLSNNGTRLAVGAPSENNSAGAVHLYNYQGDPLYWSQETMFQAPNAISGAEFGWDVHLAGPDTNPVLAIGAPGDASNAVGIGGDPTNTEAPDSGAVYTFSLVDSAWTPSAYLKAPNADPGDRFGESLVIDVNALSLCVGAPGEASNAIGIDGDMSSNDTPSAGAVYEWRLPNR